jgi:hypothetical protein
MRLPGCIVLLALAALPVQAAPPRVYGRSEIAVDASSPWQQEFRRFVSAFRAEIGRRAVDAGPAGWEFWVVLRGDPKHGGRPHVLVVARAGKLMVRVADIPAAELNAAQDANRAALRSRELMRSPAPRAAAALAR